MTVRIIPITRRDDLTFHPDGRIDLTAHVADALSLQAGDVINIACVGERFAEHYLYVARRAGETVGRHACCCRPAKNNGRYLRVNSKRLTDYVRALVHAAGTVRLRVGTPEEVAGLGHALPMILQSSR